MATQEPRLNAAETSATDGSRSRKLIAIIGSTAVVVILAATISTYYVAFRPLPTTVSWAPTASAISPGGDLAISGRVTPAERDRQVLFESAPIAQGPWEPMPQTATTDSRGRFAVTFKPQFTGLILMRVVVDPAGRYLEVTGQPKPVRLLATSSISLKGIGKPTNRTPVSFAVTVNPASAGRTVHIEQSKDKRHWVSIGHTAKTKANGTSVVQVSELAIGRWSYRARVAQDGNFAAALSPVVGATVEDYKVVEARVAAEKAKAQAAADAEAARKAESTRSAPKMGYECRPGDENRYPICAAHKAMAQPERLTQSQLEYYFCIDGGGRWNAAAGWCEGLDPQY